MKFLKRPWCWVVGNDWFAWIPMFEGDPEAHTFCLRCRKPLPNPQTKETK